MIGRANSHMVFATFVDHPSQLPGAALLVESIRTFGGSLSESYIWIFHSDRLCKSDIQLKGNGTKVISIELPERISGYPFSGKVTACARAEEMTGSLYKSLVWMASDCLVLGPPTLFDLSGSDDAALRPVHISNVGSPAGESPDGYWEGIFNAIGIKDLSRTVESFVDCKTLRAYYNTHAFAVNPSRGLMSKWLMLLSK